LRLGVKEYSLRRRRLGRQSANRSFGQACEPRKTRWGRQGAVGRGGQAQGAMPLLVFAWRKLCRTVAFVGVLGYIDGADFLRNARRLGVDRERPQGIEHQRGERKPGCHSSARPKTHCPDPCASTPLPGFGSCNSGETNVSSRARSSFFVNFQPERRSTPRRSTTKVSGTRHMRP